MILKVLGWLAVLGTVVFIVLDLYDKVGMNWWWLLSPLWIYILIVFAVWIVLEILYEESETYWKWN